MLAFNFAPLLCSVLCFENRKKVMIAFFKMFRPQGERGHSLPVSSSVFIKLFAHQAWQAALESVFDFSHSY